MNHRACLRPYFRYFVRSWKLIHGKQGERTCKLLQSPPPLAHLHGLVNKKQHNSPYKYIHTHMHSHASQSRMCVCVCLCWYSPLFDFEKEFLARAQMTKKRLQRERDSIKKKSSHYRARAALRLRLRRLQASAQLLQRDNDRKRSAAQRLGAP